MRKFIYVLCQVLVLIWSAFMAFGTIFIIIFAISRFPKVADVVAIGVWLTVWFVPVGIVVFLMHKLEPQKPLWPVHELRAWITRPRTAPKPRIKQIAETKATCTACSHVYFFGMTDVIDHTAATMDNFSNSLLCCGGCWPMIFAPEKRSVDPNRCPKCGSRAIKKERVVHAV